MPLRVSPGVRWSIVAGEAVLLDLEQKQYFALDELGLFEWERLARGDELDAIVADVVATYDVDSETARRDLAALIDRLVAEKLLVRE